MSNLNAKPSGGYQIGSTAWNENIDALWSYASGLGYSEEAFSGMMGNAQAESGINPWRWQSDEVNQSKGYGLFQYTPASGYLYTYGPTSSYYAPNTSTTQVVSGAYPYDGYAQIECIPASGKYGSGETRRNLIRPYVPDYASYETINNFKTCNDVTKATYLWVGFFECPGWWLSQSNVQTNISGRITAAEAVYTRIHGSAPGPGPDPGPGPGPEPEPGTDEDALLWAYFMCIRKS